MNGSYYEVYVIAGCVKSKVRTFGSGLEAHVYADWLREKGRDVLVREHRRDRT